MTNGARSAKDLGVNRVTKRLRDNIQLTLGIVSSVESCVLSLDSTCRRHGNKLSRVPKVFAQKLFEYMLGACEKHKVQQNLVSPAMIGVD
jgi:hypothetical protein